jgi:hypothetical protein
VRPDGVVFFEQNVPMVYSELIDWAGIQIVQSSSHVNEGGREKKIMTNVY